MAKRVTGLGGIFFKSKDPAKLQQWYEDHLDIKPLPHSPWGPDDTAPLFEWRDTENPDKKGHTVFGVFPDDTDYFEPGSAPFMFNFRVDDLDAVLTALKAEGIAQIGDIREMPFGRFARIADPEGNQVELWEPAQGF